MVWFKHPVIKHGNWKSVIMAIGNLEVVFQLENHLQRWIFHFHVIGDDGSKAWVCDRPEMYKARRISSGGAWTADCWNHQKQNCKSTTWSHDTASSAFKYRESQVAKSWSAWASPPGLWTHPASAARGPAISWSVRPRILKVFSFALIDAAYTYIHTIQYNTIQYNTIQYSTVQYSTVQYNTIQYNTYNTLHYITLHYITLQYNTIQYNTYNTYNTLHYITIQYNTIHTIHYIQYITYNTLHTIHYIQYITYIHYIHTLHTYITYIHSIHNIHNIHNKHTNIQTYKHTNIHTYIHT